MKNFLSFVVATLFAASMMAAVGPQSVQVTFSGTDSENWIVSSGGSILSVADGVVNVQMAVQSSGKYRADFQHQTAGTFIMDKAKDIVWAIKLTAALPGTANARKFEIQYNDGADKWINDINGPSGSLDCEDGGKIYYFNLGADGLNKLSDLPDGAINIKKIHYIFADATELTDETAKYSVDWVASFETVNDLKSFADWNDDKELGNEVYHELLFRPKADGSGYDKRGNSFRAADVEFEGNYQAGLFAIEYFLVDKFNAAKDYELVLTTTGSNTSDLAVWNFPYQVNYEEAAADIITKATAVVGVAPRATEGDITAPAASAKIADGAWKFTVAGSKLTVLATKGEKSLVALLVTSHQATTANQKGKYASAANTEKAHPTLKLVDDATAISNTAAEHKAVKRIVNGKFVIEKNGKLFDLTGAQL